MPGGGVGLNVPAGRVGLNVPAGGVGLNVPGSGVGLNVPGGRVGLNVPGGGVGLNVPGGRVGLNMPGGRDSIDNLSNNIFNNSCNNFDWSVVTSYVSWQIVLIALLITKWTLFIHLRPMCLDVSFVI